MTSSLGAVMDDEQQQTLNHLRINLRIVSLLREGDRLSTTESVFFAIERPHYWSGLLRWWYGECRGNAIERVQELLDLAVQQKSQPLIERLVHQAVQGLRVLRRSTYQMDAATCCKLDHMIDMVRAPRLLLPRYADALPFFFFFSGAGDAGVSSGDRSVASRPNCTCMILAKPDSLSRGCSLRSVSTSNW